MARQSFTRREALIAAGAAALAGCTSGKEDEASPTGEPPAEPGPSPTITPVDSSTWDATYYQPKYTSQDEARAAGEEVARRIEAEGIVLLRNVGNVLPLAPADHRNGGKVAFTLVNGTEKRHTLGTNRGGVRGNLDVGTRVNRAVSQEQCRAHGEMRIRAVGGRSCLKCRFYQHVSHFICHIILLSRQEDAVPLFLRHQSRAPCRDFWA